MVNKGHDARDLAGRLNALELGRFEATADGTVKRAHSNYYVSVIPVNVGRGRPYEVRQALALPQREGDVVLVADEFSPGAVDLLQEANANYMDRRRLYLRLSTPEFLVHVVDDVESTPKEESDVSLALDGAAGAVAIALLNDPDGRHRVTGLAEQARVSPATAQKVVFALERAGFLETQGRGPQKTRRVVDPAALLDRYATDAAADRRKVVRCRILGDGVVDLAERAHGGLKKAKVKNCLTGTAAAAIEAPALTGYPVAEFWVTGPRSPEYLLRAVDAIEAEAGANLLLWRATRSGPFGGMRDVHKYPTSVPLASPFRVYADLLANPQRGREQAEVYREKVIRF